MHDIKQNSSLDMNGKERTAEEMSDKWNAQGQRKFKS